MVIGVPDTHWGEAIKDVCRLNEEASVSADEIIQFTASRTARYKKPKHIVFVKDFPRTADGKIDRLKVKAELGGG